MELVRDLCLDTAATAGLTSERSPAIAVGRANAVQFAATVYVLTATTLVFQLEQSFDAINWWRPKGSQSVDAIGRHVLTLDAGIASTYARVTFSLTGSGEAVFDVFANLSVQ